MPRPFGFLPLFTEVLGRRQPVEKVSTRAHFDYKSGSDSARIGVLGAQSGIKADTKGVYQHAGEYCELRHNGVLGISGTASQPLERHYSSTAMASISTSCPSTASIDTPNSVLAVPAIPDSCTAAHTDPRSARSPATT